MTKVGGGVEEEIKTVSSGSEFLFDFYCELCKDDGKLLEAEGFCVDCKEYLCGSCYSGHLKSRLSRNHELLDKSEMPKDTPLCADRINRDISTKCKIHAGKPVEYYCDTHKMFGCCNCFVERHRRCSDIEPILEKSSGIFESQDFKTFIQTLKSLDQTFRDINKKAQTNIARAKICYSEVIKTVKHLKEEIIVTLDRLERDIIEEAKTLATEEEKKMTAISNKCSGAAEEIGTLLTDIKSLESSKRLCQVYISMKESDGRVKTLQDDGRAFEESLAVRTFKFEPNWKVKDFTESPNTLGSISCEVQNTTETHEEEANKHMLRKAKHVYDIDLGSKTDDSTCCISGSAVVSCNRLIIVDYDNSKLKLLDTTTNQVISETEVIGGPCDVTALSRNQAAVTLSDSKKILLLSVSDTLTQSREITVRDSCYGVTYSKNRLIVTYINPARVEIMDLSGSVMKTIQDVLDGKQLFQEPYYVCVNYDGDILYVSDFGSSTVARFTFDGMLKSKYSDSELTHLNGVCVDHHGNVYACSGDRGNLHMLTADLIKIQIILTQSDGLDSYLWSVSHCQETNKLYVGMANKNLKVYQLT